MEEFAQVFCTLEQRISTLELDSHFSQASAAAKSLLQHAQAAMLHFDALQKTLAAKQQSVSMAAAMNAALKKHIALLQKTAFPDGAECEEVCSAVQDASNFASPIISPFADAKAASVKESASAALSNGSSSSIAQVTVAEWNSLPKYLKTAKITHASLNEYIRTLNDMAIDVQRLLRMPTHRLTMEQKERVNVRSLATFPFITNM